MMVITAVVSPDRLDDVIRAVSGAGARGLTVTDVRGFGQQYGHMDGAAPADWQAALLHKLRIDMVVPDAEVEPVTSAVAKAVYTGSVGDGKIWVSPVSTALRVRTGERDWEAV